MELSNYNEEFLKGLNKHLFLYTSIGFSTAESPMWFQYRGWDRERNVLEFKSSQRSLGFEIPLHKEDEGEYINFEKTYEHFKKLKYSHIQEKFPTVYQELRK